MSIYTINITNMSSGFQSFYIFQAPFECATNSNIYSNSLFSAGLPPYENSGSTLQLQVSNQYYSAVQAQSSPLMIGSTSSGSISAQPVTLTNASDPSFNNVTYLNVNPLGLAPACSQGGVTPGAFRVVTQNYNANSVGNINIGLATKINGSLVLSSFLEGQPGQNLDCSPTPIFFVQTGNFQAGSLINLYSAYQGAAICEATTENSNFNVTYNIDGSFSVKAY